MRSEDVPEPPPDLAAIRIVPISFGERVFRTHGINRGPVHYGTSGLYRFDSPDRSYGALYAGGDPFCAFIETFGSTVGTRVVTTTELKARAISELQPDRAIQLIDLTQSGTLVRIGADTRLFSGSRKIAQLWSRALHQHPCRAHGILYRSRLDPERDAIVLFGDRDPKLIELNRQSWYAPGPQRLLLAKIMDHYGFELIETRFVTARKPAATQGVFFEGE